MRRRMVVMGALAATSYMVVKGATAQSALSQDIIKAAFLSRFASFVQWPAGAFADAHAPIRLCIVGDSGFAPVLQRSAARQTIDGRSFDVRRLPDSSGVRDCHIVYVTGASVDETLRAVHSRPILTVTDGASGGARGIIHFAVVDDHLRFHIDDAQAAEAGLTISSRLLALAVSVRRRTT